MEYIQAGERDLNTIFDIVQKTIKDIYPIYYPQEVVEFFCTLHNRESIKKDISSNRVGMLIDKNIIIGTGCYRDNHITRVYVLPEYQGRGYGTHIMNCLEQEISKQYKIVYLDASLPAKHMYEKRDYVIKEHCKFEVENNVTLTYEVMEKEIKV